jgi:hypothetical protein
VVFCNGMYRGPPVFKFWREPAKTELTMALIVQALQARGVGFFLETDLQYGIDAHPRTKMDPDTEHQDKVDDGETSPCPLFMDSLPKNFAENPSLAALASLLDDDIGDNDSGHGSSIASPQIGAEDNSKQESVESSLARNRIQSETRQGGGGKVHFPKSRHSRARQTQPYPNARIRDASASKTPSKRDPVKPEATLGEAQLFLKLWKL